MPQGTGHVFLAFGFAVQSFIMGTHKKHEAQDEMVHWLLCVSMIICFAFVLLELHAPRNPLPALGRGAAALFQGAWLCQIAKIEFEHLPQWEEEYGGGSMMAPVYFVTIAVLVIVAITVLALVMGGIHHLGIVPLFMLPSEDDELTLAQYTRVLNHSEDIWGEDCALGVSNDLHEGKSLLSTSEHGGVEAPIHSICGHSWEAEDSFGNDSAKSSSNEGSPTPQRRVHFAPFQIAHSPLENSSNGAMRRSQDDAMV